ncbi:MAG: hypothetical protein WD018_07610 [Nitrosopumilaceae archaeon]
MTCNIIEVDFVPDSLSVRTLLLMANKIRIYIKDVSSPVSISENTRKLE